MTKSREHSIINTMKIGDRVLKRAEKILMHKGYNLRIIRRGKDLRVEISKGQETIKLTIAVGSLDILSEWLKEG